MVNSTGTIFINYRKDDSRWNSLALYNELQKYFGKEQLFKDFNTIAPGDDFVKSIESALQKCNVLLVVIGPEWLNMKDDNGQRRLDDPDDFVRLEIATALSREIKVIPVMIDNTPMPKESELPDNLKSLYRRQFVEIDNTRFEDDVRNLAEAIEKSLFAKLPLANTTNVLNVSTTTAQTLGAQTYSLPRPDNYLVLAIISTICCVPFGIISIMAANKVDSLWEKGLHLESTQQSSKAKTWAIIGLIATLFIYLIYALAMYGQSLKVK